MSLKLIFALCLLGIGCNASHHVNLEPALAVQQAAMRHLMKSFDSTSDPMLINKCFNSYMNDQTVVVAEYNNEYNGCLDTAQAAKDLLTAQSADQREDLLSRGNNMCGTLSVCDQHTDGLEFFDCYRNASSDSYKVMFTLNSDSNAHFNYLSASYSVIETDLSACIDEARVAYAKKMDKANEDLQICLNGGVAPSSTTAQPQSTVTVTQSTSTGQPQTTVSDAQSSSSAQPESTSTVTQSTTSGEFGESSTSTQSSTEAEESTTVENTTDVEETTTEVITEDTTVVVVTTTEGLPEEDLDRALPVAQSGFWSFLRRF